MPPAPGKDKVSLQEILLTLRREMPNLEQKYHVKSLGIFGPYARGTNRPRSALNLVVEYDRTPTLISLAELERHLQHLLGLRVDLGNKRDLKPYVKERVLTELVPV